MTRKPEDLYTFRLAWSENDKKFIGLCAEFPSLSWLGSSPEEGLKGIRKIVRSTLRDMRFNDEDAPEPISSKNYSGKFMVRVTPDTHRMLAQAAESDVSLNRLVSSKLG